jgi:hypothetical protein
MFAALGQRFSGEELRAMGSRFLATKQKLLETEVSRPPRRPLPIVESYPAPSPVSAGD